MNIHITPTQMKLHQEKKRRDEIFGRVAVKRNAKLSFRPKLKPVPKQQTSVVEAFALPSVTLPLDGFSTTTNIIIREPSMKEIALEVLRQFPSVTLELINSHRRVRYLILPRHLVYHTIKVRQPMRSLPEIGFRFNRDHTSILHGVNKIDQYIADGTLDAEIRKWHKEFGRIASSIEMRTNRWR